MLIMQVEFRNVPNAKVLEGFHHHVAVATVLEREGPRCTVQVAMGMVTKMLVNAELVQARAASLAPHAVRNPNTVLVDHIVTVADNSWHWRQGWQHKPQDLLVRGRTGHHHQLKVSASLPVAGVSCRCFKIFGPPAEQVVLSLLPGKLITRSAAPGS